MYCKRKNPFSQVNDSYCSKRFKNTEDQYYGEEEDTDEELYFEEDDPDIEVLYVERVPLVEEEEDPEEEGVDEEGAEEEEHVEEHIEEEERVEQEVKAETEKIEEVEESIGQQDEKFNRDLEELKRVSDIICSEDDEIAVLQGMIDFHKTTGNYACDNITAFLEFVKVFLHDEVSQEKLYDKIRQLKEKYKNNKERLEDGQTLNFFIPHEEELFRLSLKIWGSENKEKKEGEEEDFWSMYPNLNESLKLDQFSGYTLPSYGANYIKQKLSCIGNWKAKELEEKWRRLEVAETQVKLMKARLIEEQTELILKTIS